MVRIGLTGPSEEENKDVTLYCEIMDGNTIKGGSSFLTCLVEDLGHPEAVEFLWTQGNDILDEKSETLTSRDIGLASLKNISCSAINEIGAEASDSPQLEVLTPPKFITMFL